MPGEANCGSLCSNGVRTCTRTRCNILIERNPEQLVISGRALTPGLRCAVAFTTISYFFPRFHNFFLGNDWIAAVCVMVWLWCAWKWTADVWDGVIGVEILSR